MEAESEKFEQKTEFILDDDYVWDSFRKPSKPAPDHALSYKYFIRSSAEDADADDTEAFPAPTRQLTDKDEEDEDRDDDDDENDDDRDDEDGDGDGELVVKDAIRASVSSKTDQPGRRGSRVPGNKTSQYDDLTHEKLWKLLQDEANSDTIPMADWLRVIEFSQCLESTVESLIKALLPNNSDALEHHLLSFLEKKPKDGQGFYTGSQLRGIHSKMTPMALLFVSLPIMNFERGQAGSKSVSLSKFFKQDAEFEASCPAGFPEVFVHQAWFMVFGNETIAIFQDAEWHQPVALPEQPRMGSIHFLAQAITSVMRPSDDVPRRFAEQYETVQHKIDRVRLTMTRDVVDGRDADQRTAVTVLESAQKTLEYAALAARVMTEQAKIVDGLLAFLKSSKMDNQTNRSTADGKSVKVPCISDYKEQIPFTLPILNTESRHQAGLLTTLCTRQSSIRHSYEQLVLQIRKPEPPAAQGGSQDSETAKAIRDFILSQQIQSGQPQTVQTVVNTGGGSGPSQAALDKASLAELLEQLLEATKDNQDELASQGELFSFFTLVTTIFLPLAFFTQYFALPLGPAETEGNIVTTHSAFWKYSGPFIGAFLAFVLVLVLFKKEYSAGEIFKTFFYDCPLYLVTCSRYGHLHVPKTRRQQLDEEKDREKRNREDVRLQEIRDAQKELEQKKRDEKWGLKVEKIREKEEKRVRKEEERQTKRRQEMEQRQRKKEEELRRQREAENQRRQQAGSVLPLPGGLPQSPPANGGNILEKLQGANWSNWFKFK